jgi:iron(III) transport system permease protein
MNMAINNKPIMPTYIKRIKGTLNNDSAILAGILLILTLLMGIFILAPMFTMFVKSVQDVDGHFIGLTNFTAYFSSRAMIASITNTLTVGLLTTTIVGLLAFSYAYALTRSCMPAKTLFKIMGSAPILAPSLLPALSLIYLFGNQGIAKELLGGASIYGVVGITIGLTFWTFPHALMILTTALRTSDARLYEAATVLKNHPVKTFFMVTLPAAKYGVISTLILVFTLVVCDFGVPKVIGGSYNVLATDIFKQVVGQQNFAMGAVTSVLLLLPAVLAFAIDQQVQRKQKNLFDSRSVVYVPKPNGWRDGICFAFCSGVALAILVIISMAIYASFVTFWPWNLTLSFNNYHFSEVSTYGWSPYFNSLILASWVAVVGTVIIFIGAYVIEKGRGFGTLRRLLQMITIIPMAVPGIVLGLGYIFFFNDINNPLNGLYATMTLLVVNTVVHYYTVGHMTALTALKQLPAEIEAISASIKMPQYKSFFMITLPICAPAIMDIAAYLFINALTTTSAVVFLYASDTIPASVSVLNMDDAGQTGSAAAMAVMILATAALAKIMHLTAASFINKKTQAWRQH